eukprot:GFUD01042164.1.p1 GENE.GFUD01042164.1~~GFUD01042164.1.p1  ORF type:complete len:528 (-),score=132.90 GFUD01042164.1:315-1898(-)
MAETMYALKPVFDLDAKVDIPACMYSLPVIQSSTPIAGIGGARAICPLAVEALEARQDAILARLGQLKDQVSAYKKSIGLPDVAVASPTANVTKTADIVIRCSPSFPAFSLKGIYSMLTASGLTVHTSCHTHCTVASLPPNVQSFLPVTEVARSTAQVRITLIWTEVGKDCELMVSPLAQTVIKGETNLLRYFSRLFPTIFPYESLPNLMAVDSMLDNVSSLQWAAPRAKQPLLRTLAVNLAKAPYLAGPTLSIADLALYSCIRQLGLDTDLQPELMRWYLTMAKQLEGKSSRNRNRNSSMRKSVSSPKKADIRKTHEVEKSPKKEPAAAKKGKSPTKEVKIEKNPPTKSGKENCPPSQPLNSAGNHMGKDKLFEYFTKNGIKYNNVDHPEVFTVEAMMPFLKNVQGAICKNLFLKDKKKNLYLLSAVHDKEVKLNDVAKKVGAKELRFGDESVMFEILGVSQGCVTAYALANDQKKSVKFIVDSSLLDGTYSSVNFHPMINTATTQISCEDFNKFLALTGHTVLKF